MKPGFVPKRVSWRSYRRQTVENASFGDPLLSVDHALASVATVLTQSPGFVPKRVARRSYRRQTVENASFGDPLLSAGHALASVATVLRQSPAFFVLMASLFGLIVPSGNAVAESLLAPGAKVEKLAGGFKFTEGPATDAQGNVFFTDQPNDRILKWSVDGRLSTFMQPCGRSNGLCFDRAGNLWACADEKNQLWCISPFGKVTVVVKDYRGKLLNGPNDVWIRPDGGLYFSDPYYKRPYWRRGPKAQERECVYYLTPPAPATEQVGRAFLPIKAVPTGKRARPTAWLHGAVVLQSKTLALDRRTLVRVVDDLQQPNGIIGTPDGKVLYVTDIKGKKTYAYDIQPDGSLARKRFFCAMGSDGMTIDNEGNVYLTGNGVTVFSKQGVKIAHLPVPEPWTANVCFAGADMHTLMITASRGLYGVRMRVKGVGSQ